VGREREKGRGTILKRLSNLVSLFYREFQQVERFTDTVLCLAPPITGPGRGGRVGASATQHVVQGMIKSNLRDQDVCTPLTVIRFRVQLPILTFVRLCSLEKLYSNTQRKIQPKILGLQLGARVNRNLCSMTGVIVMTTWSKRDQSERLERIGGRRE